MNVPSLQLTNQFGSHLLPFCEKYLKKEQFITNSLFFENFAQKWKEIKYFQNSLQLSTTWKSA